MKLNTVFAGFYIIQLIIQRDDKENEKRIHLFSIK